MPELPEVETVKEILKRRILNKKITNVKVNYANIIENIEIDEFVRKIKNETINNIKRRGKWIIFELDNYCLLSHLRMEGKYNIKYPNEKTSKHEHVIFTLDNNLELRYSDTRKFGKMHLIEKDKVYKKEPLNLLGLEPWDDKLTKFYLASIFANKKTNIKTALLDQTIIAGIGNIYANEILFLCKINPEKKLNELKEIDIINIIKFTKIVLEKAIQEGGTTIRTYESESGVHGRFQHSLYVHNLKGNPCKMCGTLIEKSVINQRGTFYCPKCQKY